MRRCAHVIEWLVWLMLGGGIAAGCGPGLLQQVQLRQMADRSAADCKAAAPSAKTTRCQAALQCAKAAQDSVKAIQSAQGARAGAGATAGQESAAAGSYANAVATCRQGGWQ